MTEDSNSQLELDDIQSGVLRPRPTPYVATYIAFRIDDRKAGRELMRRVARVVTSAANPTSPLANTWVSVALTYEGFKALGVPQESLDSFSWEFRQGMAARAKDLGDTGESAPENWERPLGTGDIHVVLVAVSPDEGNASLAAELAATGIPHRIQDTDGTLEPAEELINAAESLDADFIVIGLRRRSPVGKRLLGSNAQRVLLDASCAVLAVKADPNI